MRRGFTIVELLIVIVVIGILAGITIVAYTSVQNRATVSSIQSDLVNAAKEINAYMLLNGNTDAVPADLATMGVTSKNTLTYIPNGPSYCLAAASGTPNSYFVTKQSSNPLPGECVVSDQLVGWWQLDNNFIDSSSSGANGTNSGAISTIGQNNQPNSAYQFNGINNYISLPVSTPLNLTDNYSISAWVKLDSDIGVNGWNDIIAGSNGDFGFGISANSSGVGYMKLTRVSTNDAASSPNSVQKNVWKHLVMTYSNTNLKYYLDGQPNSEFTTSTIFNTLTGSAKRIGQRSSGTNAGFFHGAIDDLRVYSRVLSSNEVTALYGGGAQ